jgi:hypothetical protein
MGILKVCIKVGKLRLHSYGFGEGQVAGCGKECNEPSGSIKGGKLITFPRRNLLRGFISHIYVCNIKMDLQEVGGGRGDWMELAQGRDRWRALVGTVRDFRVS